MTRAASVAATATLVHDYTMDDVERIAWSAAHRLRAPVLTLEDGHEAAWHGVVEHLYGSEDCPHFHDLMNSAVAAVAAEIRAHHQNHGVNADTGEVRPAFHKYWLPVMVPFADFTDTLVERMALPQVLGLLTDTEYEAIAALAAHGSGRAAAAALGINDKAFYERVRKARAKAVAAWFDAEAPAPRSTVRADGEVQCRAGHARSEHGYLTGSGDAQRWRCRACVNAAERRRWARSR
ncbi:hypothetical protein [Nocardioides bruguierae]|uniref:Uncharacterized protein n=1 Tax=Nocardioides bruguierae TaxID=2945102 RepID=A0A9X2D3X1_9ACTN|nr:hypothetical protein [Nocardioides bruguierae]MCM0618780.1 hypothetical protein [Nocardioides bruguierae]